MQSSLDMSYVERQFPGLAGGWTFFDNAGGAQIAQPALDRMVEFLTQFNVQIGGSYAVSQAAAQALRKGREAGATLVNAAQSDEIVFGPSTTVLLQNLATAMRRQFKDGDEIIVTMADHESNIGPWMRLAEFGVAIKIWPLNAQTGDLQIADLQALLSPRTKLVCVTHVSNILGKVHDVAAIAKVVHAAGAQICVDAVAYAPHRLIDVQAWDVDYYVFSLYKSYGPHGAMMYGKYHLLAELDGLYHYFYGKEKVPGKLEPGNPSYEIAYSVDGIVSYLTDLARHHGAKGTARELVAHAYQLITAQEDALTKRLLDWLSRCGDCQVIGEAAPCPNSSRVPTIAFRFHGRKSSEIAKAVDDFKIAIRFGDFHSRRLVEHLGQDFDDGLLRVSMVHYNTIAQVDALTAAFETILTREGADV